MTACRNRRSTTGRGSRPPLGAAQGATEGGTTLDAENCHGTAAIRSSSLPRARSDSDPAATGDTVPSPASVAGGTGRFGPAFGPSIGRVPIAS